MSEEATGNLHFKRQSNWNDALVYNLRRQFGGQVSDSLCVLLSYPRPFFSSFCHVDAFHSGQLRHEFAVLFWKTLTDGCRQ